MGTGSSKNNNVVAFDVENVPPGKKPNDQNGNKAAASWQEDVKKEQKTRSRLGVIIFSTYFKWNMSAEWKSLVILLKSSEKGAEMQFVNCYVNTIGLQLTQIAK